MQSIRNLSLKNTIEPPVKFLYNHNDQTFPGVISVDNRPLREQRGYDGEDFFFFHYPDPESVPVRKALFRDYCRVIVPVDGDLLFRVEGRTFPLQSWDVLLLTENDIAKADGDSGNTEYYEVGIKPAFLLKLSLPGNNLRTCFEQASESKRHVLRPEGEYLTRLQYCLDNLEKAYTGSEFGCKISSHAYLMLLLVWVNRCFAAGMDGIFPQDTEISRVVDYIDEHLADDLLIDRLAERFGFSKYTLMHRFKEQTGFAVHHYILQKRLRKIHALILKGYPFMEASARCGFSDYSCFVRAFTKYYGLSPRKYYERLKRQGRL